MNSFENLKSRQKAKEEAKTGTISFGDM